MFEPIYQLPTSIVLDFVLMMLGEKLGYGISRSVYVFKPDPQYVVKLETDGDCFQNVFEWRTWEDAQGTAAEKWLAPCKMISSDGSVLLMRRTEPLTRNPPKSIRLPAFLTDTKLGNYGRIGNRIVCHDYGTNLALNHGLVKSSRLRVVEWW